MHKITRVYILAFPNFFTEVFLHHMVFSSILPSQPFYYTSLGPKPQKKGKKKKKVLPTFGPPQFFLRAQAFPLPFHYLHTKISFKYPSSVFPVTRINLPLCSSSSKSCCFMKTSHTHINSMLTLHSYQVILDKYQHFQYFSFHQTFKKPTSNVRDSSGI